MDKQILRQINLADTSEIDELYPMFEEYVKQVRGFLSCPVKEEIRLWYQYLLFQAVKDYLTDKEEGNEEDGTPII